MPVPSAPAEATPSAAGSPSVASTGNRPEQPWSIGIGAGWFFPGDILAPNTASVRIMIPQVVTIEPFVSVALRRDAGLQSFQSPVPDASTDDETVDNTITSGLGTDLRFPVLRRGDLDMQFIGQVSAVHTVGLPDVAEGEEAQSNNTFVKGSYGLGIEWFFVKNIALSADALNPLVSWERSSSETKRELTFTDDTGAEQTGTAVDRAENSALNVGAIFSPSVRLMFHLYF